jgi:hypothetical protein
LMVGIILLVAGVLFEERHRAETLKQHLHPAGLESTAAPLFVLKENNFYDYVDLWGDPWVKTDDPHLNNSSLAVENSAKPASVEKFQPRVSGKTDPVLAVQDKKITYSLLDLGGFRLDVNLKASASEFANRNRVRL